MYENIHQGKKKAAPNKIENPFKAGDLVYGLARPRMKFMSLHKILFERELGPTIDAFAATATEYKFIREKAGGQYPTKQDSFEQSLLSHPKYSHIRYEMGIVRSNYADDDPLWIRRKCKAGLYWASTNNITVHFVLDGIDMNRVVSKEYEEFTSSELRWLFRHKHENGVIKAVKYYKDGDYAPAPWDAGDSKELWKSYELKRIHKSHITLMNMKIEPSQYVWRSITRAFQSRI
ncbi:hypothetical protein [Pseudomonas synxantha]|uniref:hypothetical protein n=1 Tax=Pseudomonas synxantha TaxID=47883 RepID=UPI0006144C9B|nr:hypothetical protein [Pseudomonas synxantha]